MKLYGGLPREKVLEAHSFVIKKRNELGLGQRKLKKLVLEDKGMNIKESTISNWIFRGLVPFAGEETQFKSKPLPDKEELFELYLNQKQSAESLGEKYKVSTATMVNWLKKYNIPTRLHLESMNTRIIKQVLRDKKLIHPPKKFDEMSPEKSYILGVLCGDAHINSRFVRLEIRRDEDFIKEFVRCFKEVYGLDYKYHYYPPKDTLVVQINSQIICKDLQRYGPLRTEKWIVPQEIEESKDSAVISSFLRGFYDSEGSVARSCITSSSICKDGLDGVKRLLKKLEIESVLRPIKNGKYYVLYIFRKQILSTCYGIGLNNRFSS